jgi:hypothetical protein
LNENLFISFVFLSAISSSGAISPHYSAIIDVLHPLIKKGNLDG